MTKPNYTLRYATKSDFDFFYKGEKLVNSAKAWVLCKKRNRLAIGGVWLLPMQNVAFVRVRPKVPKKEFWKVSVMMVNEWKKLNMSIACFRDEGIINSEKYLQKLGFRKMGYAYNQESQRIQETYRL